MANGPRMLCASRTGIPISARITGALPGRSSVPCGRCTMQAKSYSSIRPGPCCCRPKVDHLGVRLKYKTGLCSKSEALSVLEGAEGAKGDIDSLFVIPADIGVNCLNELLNGGVLPVPRIEQLRFRPPEEALTGRIVGRAPFARHRASQLRIVHPREPRRPAIVPTAVRVHDGPVIGVGYPLDSRVQHGVHKIGIKTCADCPADN